MAEQMNIYQKLARIRKQVEVIQKNKSGYGYKYVSEDEILAKISVFMDKYTPRSKTQGCKSTIRATTCYPKNGR